MSKFNAIFSIPEVLKQGKIVSNPEAWKSGQITVSFLAGFIGLLLSAASIFGLDLPVTQDQLLAIASGILTAFGLLNPVATVASSDKVGIKPKRN